MRLSDYVKIFKLSDNTRAYYHSLRMIPVYLTQEEHFKLQSALEKGELPDFPQSTLDTLKDCRILVDDETGLIESARSLVPEPYICMAYFILTEQCNMAFKYCFLGNSSKTPRVTDYPMSIETAEKGLRFFAEQTRKVPEYFSEEGGREALSFTAANLC